MGCVSQKAPPKPKTSATGPAGVLRKMGMTSSEFIAALGGVRCEYCSKIVRWEEKCTNCGAPRKDLA